MFPGTYFGFWFLSQSWPQPYTFVKDSFSLKIVSNLLDSLPSIPNVIACRHNLQYHYGTDCLPLPLIYRCPLKNFRYFSWHWKDHVWRRNHALGVVSGNVPSTHPILSKWFIPRRILRYLPKLFPTSSSARVSSIYRPLQDSTLWRILTIMFGKYLLLFPWLGYVLTASLWSKVHPTL